MSTKGDLSLIPSTENKIPAIIRVQDVAQNPRDHLPKFSHYNYMRDGSFYEETFTNRAQAGTECEIMHDLGDTTRELMQIKKN